MINGHPSIEHVAVAFDPVRLIEPGDHAQNMRGQMRDLATGQDQKATIGSK